MGSDCPLFWVCYSCLHPRKAGQSSHHMEQGWLFFCFPLRQIKMQDTTNNYRKERERSPVLFLSHCSKTRHLWEIKKYWRSVVNIEHKIEVWWDCLYIYSMWSLKTDLSTADSKTYSFYSKTTFLPGKSFKLLHGSSWLNSKRQRLWSVKRGTQIITGIIHRIGHLDLELKPHQTHQEITHSFQWALDLTLIQCILGWDFLCPDMHLTDPLLNSSQSSRWKPAFKQLCWWQGASWNNLNIVIPHCYL